MRKKADILFAIVTRSSIKRQGAFGSDWVRGKVRVSRVDDTSAIDSVHLQRPQAVLPSLWRDKCEVVGLTNYEM